MFFSEIVCKCNFLISIRQILKCKFIGVSTVFFFADTLHHFIIKWNMSIWFFFSHQIPC